MSLPLLVLCAALADPASEATPAAPEVPPEYQVGFLYGVSTRGSSFDGQHLQLDLPHLGAWYERAFTPGKNVGVFVGATKIIVRPTDGDELVGRWAPAVGVGVSASSHLRWYDIARADEPDTFDWSIIGGRLRAGLTWHAPWIVTTELGGEVSLFGVLHLQLFWSPTLYAARGALGRGALELDFDQQRSGLGARVMLGLSRVFREPGAP